MKLHERVISDFGGYEKCKDILKQPNIDFIMNAQALGEHMLEYRRQHNIFEAGDFVVYGSVTALFIVEQEVMPMLLRHSRTERIFRKPVGGNMRHATPEEIEAGRRL